MTRPRCQIVCVAYGNMGNIFQTQGDLDKAMQMVQKALDINEALGRKEGMASDYGNMGNILVLSQAVHEDTVRLSMGTIIQQGPRIAGRQLLSRSQIASCESYAPPQCLPK